MRKQTKRKNKFIQNFKYSGARVYDDMRGGTRLY